ncbi:MAG: DUF4255 domain-containing protein [Planctomycetaceae bacterium]|nr:DUF4255 domain-containing protein [Planctomycetaceae bacterium]
MIDQVAELLVKLLNHPDPTVPEKDRVIWTVAKPKDAASPGGKPHASVHLYDVREAVDYRENLPARHREGNQWREFPPVLHLSASFLLCETGVSDNQKKAGKILAAASRFMLRHGELRRTNPGHPWIKLGLEDYRKVWQNADPDDEFLETQLAQMIRNNDSQYIPIRLAVVSEGPLGQPELWTALKITQRPCLVLTATISLPEASHDPGPPVVRRTLRVGEMTGKKARVDDESYAVKFIGKATFQGQPVKEASVTITVADTGSTATVKTNPTGNYELMVFLTEGGQLDKDNPPKRKNLVRLAATGTIEENGQKIAVSAEEWGEQLSEKLPAPQGNSGYALPFAIEWDIELK